MSAACIEMRALAQEVSKLNLFKWSGKYFYDLLPSGEINEVVRNMHTDFWPFIDVQYRFKRCKFFPIEEAVRSQFLSEYKSVVYDPSIPLPLTIDDLKKSLKYEFKGYHIGRLDGNFKISFYDKYSHKCKFAEFEPKLDFGNNLVWTIRKRTIIAEGVDGKTYLTEHSTDTHDTLSHRDMIKKYYAEVKFSSLVLQHLKSFCIKNCVRVKSSEVSLKISGHEFIFHPDGGFEIKTKLLFSEGSERNESWNSNFDYFQLLTNPAYMKYFANAKRLQSNIPDLRYDPNFDFLFTSDKKSPTDKKEIGETGDKKEIGETGPKGPKHGNGDAGCPKSWLNKPISHDSDKKETSKPEKIFSLVLTELLNKHKRIENTHKENKDESRLTGSTGPSGETGCGKILPMVLRELLSKRKEINTKLEADKFKPESEQMDAKIRDIFNTIENAYKITANALSAQTGVRKPQPLVEIVDLDGNVYEPLARIPLVTIVFKKEQGGPNPPFKEVLIQTENYLDMTYADPVYSKFSCAGVFKVQLFTDGTLAEYHAYTDANHKTHRIRFEPDTRYTELTDSIKKPIGHIYN